MQLVSIILPVHNGEKYLTESIQSILAQTYQNFELIIVNDRSSDNSVAIAETFSKRDKRVKIMHNIMGGKLPGTLNFGFSHASGDYFTWWSDDNLMYPEMIEKLVSVLDNYPDFGCVTANSANMDTYGTIISYNNLDLKVKQSILVSNNFGASFLYRSDVAKKVGAYSTDLFLVEDYDFFIRMILATKRYHIPEKLCSIRYHPDSLSMQYDDEIRQKDAELKHYYLSQFKPILNNDDYCKVLLKIYQYHPNILIKYRAFLLCVTLFPHKIIALLGKKLFKLFR